MPAWITRYFRSSLASALSRGALLFMALIFLHPPVFAADTAANVEQVLRDIRQDQPVPALDYLHRTESLNADSGYFSGRYGDIDITVETHPNSDRVSSILLQIAGPDRTREILPAVSRVIGPPSSNDRKHSIYGWEWPKYRTASVHYADGGGGKDGLTVVSIFYR